MEEGQSCETAVIIKAKEEEEEMVEYKFIPEEIVLNILPNLPAASLLRFRCVSKQWANPISPAITHVRKVIVSGNHPFSFRSIDEKAQLEDIEIELDKTFTWHHPNVFPIIYCSCNGFLLIGVGINLFLWNPSTCRIHGMLTYNPLAKYGREKMIMGLCFDSVNNEHKVVLGLNHRDERSVWMGSFKAKSWSRVNFLYDVGNFKSGPALENYVYWWSKDEIICFDPKIFNFKKMSRPGEGDILGLGDDILGLGVLDGRLCMALASYDYSTATVFGRKRYEGKESWEIIFTFNRYEVERRYYGDETYVTVTHLVPIVFTRESRVLIHLRRTEYELHYCYSDCGGYDPPSDKLRDEYALVEYDFHNNVTRDIVVSKVTKKQPFEWPVVYEETLVRPVPPRNVRTSNNSRKVWKVKENETQLPKVENEEVKNSGMEFEGKWEAPRRRKGKKSGAASSSARRALCMGNAFDLLDE